MDEDDTTMDTMMQQQQLHLHEKVHVVLSKEMQQEDGLSTLNWILNYWSSQSSHQLLSIVILFITSSSSSSSSSSSLDLVDTPFGKLPATSVNDNMLQIISNCEQQKTDKLLSNYIAFCGKVRTEVHKINNTNDQPIQKTLVDLIIQKRITKLVMGMTFMRSSSGRTKSAISESVYIHRTKPDFCELFILFKGKLVMVKEENDGGCIEDEEGVVVAKLKQKTSFKGWFGKMLSHGQVKSSSTCPSTQCLSSANSDSLVSRNRNQWEFYEQDIEEYYQELMMSESKSIEDKDNNIDEIQPYSMNDPNEQNILADSIQGPGDRVEDLKNKIQAARKMIESNKNVAKAEVDRQAKASWAICLCNHRAEQLQAHTEEEIKIRNDLTKEIEETKEDIQETLPAVEDSNKRLNSLFERQSELSSRLHFSSLAKLGVEGQLEKAAKTRAELVKEIEELRKQRDVFQRRIDFCKEKDAIGLATRMSEPVSCSYREFSANEIRLATDNFAIYRRIASGRDGSSVYKGRISCMSVAVKMLDSHVGMTQETFQAKVNLLAYIRHPNIIAFIGFCSELKCFVFEYMHNGCLRDILFSRIKARTLKWHQRIQIATQVTLALRFLHLAEPRPIVSGYLNPSAIFLDRNVVAKLQSFNLTPCSNESDIQAEVVSFGDLLLQLLTGRNWTGVHEAKTIDKHAIFEALDKNAGDWPFDLVEEVVELATKCRSINSETSVGAFMSSVTEELNRLKKKADEVITRKEDHILSEDHTSSGHEWSHTPTSFLCPILQVVMENPHIAADGYSYELEAIEEWLRMGHDTSPVTNQKLKHKQVIPNKNLRFLIQDWRKLTSLLENANSSNDDDSGHLNIQSTGVPMCLSKMV